MVEKAILFDATKCMGCRGCQVACKQWNELAAVETTNQGSYENPPDLSPDTWLTMKFKEASRNGTVDWFFTRRSCMHCTDAACVEVCPTHALYHHPNGFVAYDKSKCTGCGYCLEFCPFDVPRLEDKLVKRASGLGLMDKCTLCTTPGLDRVAMGEEPACVKTCPPGALIYGDRGELVAEGRERVQSLRAEGHGNAYLYGERELGGLNVLYVLADSPEVYGLPVEPKYPVAATAWQDVLRPLGWVAFGTVGLGLVLNLMVARARRIREQEESENAKRG
ncbi:4Fe-4S dicluster domain-containing protein [Chloroflexota bacterium]